MSHRGQVNEVVCIFLVHYNIQPITYPKIHQKYLFTCLYATSANEITRWHFTCLYEANRSETFVAMLHFKDVLERELIFNYSYVESFKFYSYFFKKIRMILEKV